ncbi:hypothetical protein SAMN05216317_1115 [Nitrosomonas eutropha]|nr:hypothetical protein SAMN05216317_1115 [Nitrosomonas eutropha]
MLKGTLKIGCSGTNEGKESAENQDAEHDIHVQHIITMK